MKLPNQLKRQSLAEHFQKHQLPLFVAPRVLNGDFVPHDHDFMELEVVYSGSATHRTIYGSHRIGVGDVLILRPGAWHAYADCRNLKLYNCCFSIQMLQREFHWFEGDPLLHYLFFVRPLAVQQKGILATRLARNLLDEARVELNRLQVIAGLHPSSLRAEQIGRFLTFLSCVARGFQRNQKTFKAESYSRMHPAVEKALKLFQMDVSRDWSLSELCGQLAGVNAAYLVRLFKKHTGESPIAYHARYRAEQAATLLLRTDLRVSEVGERVGWVDPNYFAKRFRSFFGCSPTEYRERVGL
jgi:AraC family transcriptional regulator, L-rhamnose operon transcriptional activator RhaR